MWPCYTLRLPVGHGSAGTQRRGNDLLAIVTGWVVAAISAGGYAGVALLMAIESACIPLPSEIIMPFAGYLVSTGTFNLWLAALAGALGCNLGSTVAYYVGIYGGRPFVERWGRYALLDPRDLDRAERFFDRFGTEAVLIARLLPVVRTFIALPAGMARMRQLPFQIYTFVGSYVWCLGLAYVGQRLGEQWNNDPRLAHVLHRLDAVIVVLGARRGRSGSSGIACAGADRLVTAEGSPYRPGRLPTEDCECAASPFSLPCSCSSPPGRLKHRHRKGRPMPGCSARGSVGCFPRR